MESPTMAPVTAQAMVTPRSRSPRQHRKPARSMIVSPGTTSPVKAADSAAAAPKTRTYPQGSSCPPRALTRLSAQDEAASSTAKTLVGRTLDIDRKEHGALCLRSRGRCPRPPHRRARRGPAIPHRPDVVVERADARVGDVAAVVQDPALPIR